MKDKILNKLLAVGLTVLSFIALGAAIVLMGLIVKIGVELFAFGYHIL